MIHYSVKKPIDERKFPYIQMGMDSNSLTYVEYQSKSGAPSHSVKRKKKRNKKRLSQMYSTQRKGQNDCIFKKKVNKEINCEDDYLQRSFSNNLNTSNRSDVSETKGKKNKVRHHNIHLAASAICKDYLSKKLKSVNGVPKLNSNSELSTFSDKDDMDLFFFDLSGNKISCSSDSKKENQNKFVSSLSPQDVVRLGKNKETFKKKSDSKKNYRDDVNSNKNMSFIDIRDSDCEMTVSSNYSFSKRNDKKKQTQIEGPGCFQQMPSTLNQESEMMVENTNNGNVGKRHFEKVEKSKCNSKEKKIKKASDFEKSFFETLLEYYTSQSTPVQSENEGYVQNNCKQMTNDMNVNDYNSDKICNKKKIKHKRRRSDSGDRIQIYTSSSDENKEDEKGSDISLRMPKKKRKSGYKIQQSESNISISKGEIGTPVDMYVDCSEYQINHQSKKHKKKDHAKHSSLQISSENLENKNYERKNSKSKCIDNELEIRSDEFDPYLLQVTLVQDISSEKKTPGGEESFLQGPDGEQELESLKTEEYKRKKCKRKSRESKCIDDADLDYETENVIENNKNYNKHSKFKFIDNELKIKSDEFDPDLLQVTGVQDLSSGRKTTGGEVSFLQGPDGEKELKSLKTKEYKRKKCKKKARESTCIDEADLDYETENVIIENNKNDSKYHKRKHSKSKCIDNELELRFDEFDPDLLQVTAVQDMSSEKKTSGGDESLLHESDDEQDLNSPKTKEYKRKKCKRKKRESEFINGADLDNRTENVIIENNENYSKHNKRKPSKSKYIGDELEIRSDEFDPDLLQVTAVQDRSSEKKTSGGDESFLHESDDEQNLNSPKTKEYKRKKCKRKKLESECIDDADLDNQTENVIIENNENDSKHNRRKPSKSKCIGDELEIRSDEFDPDLPQVTGVQDMSSEKKTSADEHELNSLKTKKYERKKCKTKNRESKCIDDADLDNERENVIIENNKNDSKHHKGKHTKPKCIDNDSEMRSDEFDPDLLQVTAVQYLSSEKKTSGGDESFLNESEDEQDLNSPKTKEYKRKKCKRKKRESECIDGADLDIETDNVIVDVLSTDNIVLNIKRSSSLQFPNEEKGMESPNNTKNEFSKKKGKSEIIGDLELKNELEIESSESELNSSQCFSKKKRRSKELDTVNDVSSTSQETDDEQRLECLDKVLLNSTKKDMETGSSKKESKIEFSESKLDMGSLFTERSRGSDTSSLSIENETKSIFAEYNGIEGLEKISPIKSNVENEIRCKANTLLGNTVILNGEKTPTRKIVSLTLDRFEELFSQKKTGGSESSLNHYFEKKKKITKLYNSLEDNHEDSVGKLSKLKVPDGIYEPNFESNTIENEMTATVPAIESGTKRKKTGEKLKFGKDKSNTYNERHEIEESPSVVHEPDGNMGSPTMKEEELDILYNELEDFSHTEVNESDRSAKNRSTDSKKIIEEGSESDSSAKSRSADIQKINEDIRASIDSEHVGAEVLKNLNIHIPFAIPPLHVLLERPSKLNDLDAYENSQIKLGPYSKEEDETIKNNWKRFCKEHHLNIEPSAFFKLPRTMAKEEKVKFQQYISHGLENRLPQKVHNRFKILFGNMVYKTGRFTKAEDKVILEFMETESSKKPFTDLGKLLNRANNSVERHYKRLRDQQRLNWTPSRAEQLIKCMLKVAKLETPEQLKDCKLTAKQWKKLSKKMEGIPVIKLQRAWSNTIYPRLFSSGNLKLAKKLVIDILDERQESDWRLVNWKEISKRLPGFSHEKLYMMFKKLVTVNVPEHLQKDLRECIKFLKGRRIATPHKFRKYVYRKGHLVYEDASESDDNFTI